MKWEYSYRPEGVYRVQRGLMRKLFTFYQNLDVLHAYDEKNIASIK